MLILDNIMTLCHLGMFIRRLSAKLESFFFGKLKMLTNRVLWICFHFSPYQEVLLVISNESSTNSTKKICRNNGFFIHRLNFSDLGLKNKMQWWNNFKEWFTTYSNFLEFLFSSKIWKVASLCNSLRPWKIGLPCYSRKDSDGASLLTLN